MFQLKRVHLVQFFLFQAETLELDLTTAVEEFESRLIDEALRRSKGNKQAAARLLGVKRTTLVAKLRRKRGTTDASAILQQND